MPDEESDLAPIGEDARINTLDERLRAARKREDDRTKPKAAEGADASYQAGNRVLAELLGGMMGGAFIGWVIDQVVGRGHIGLLVMLFVGVGVAFRNIIRISSRPPE